MLAPDQLSHLSHSEQHHINLASFSPNGKYLVTADEKGVMLVWSVKVPRKSGSQAVNVKADMFKAIRKLTVGSAYQGIYVHNYRSIYLSYNLSYLPTYLPAPISASNLPVLYIYLLSTSNLPPPSTYLPNLPLPNICLT